MRQSGTSVIDGRDAHRPGQQHSGACGLENRRTREPAASERPGGTPSVDRFAIHSRRGGARSCIPTHTVSLGAYRSANSRACESSFRVIVQTAIDGKADALCTRDRHLLSPEAIEHCRRHAVRIMDDIDLYRILAGGKTG